MVNSLIHFLLLVFTVNILTKQLWWTDLNRYTLKDVKRLPNAKKATHYSDLLPSIQFVADVGDHYKNVFQSVKLSSKEIANLENIIGKTFNEDKFNTMKNVSLSGGTCSAKLISDFGIMAYQNFDEDQDYAFPAQQINFYIDPCDYWEIQNAEKTGGADILYQKAAIKYISSIDNTWTMVYDYLKSYVEQIVQDMTPEITEDPNAKDHTIEKVGGILGIVGAILSMAVIFAPFFASILIPMLLTGLAMAGSAMSITGLMMSMLRPTNGDDPKYTQSGFDDMAQQVIGSLKQTINKEQARNINSSASNIKITKQFTSWTREFVDEAVANQDEYFLPGPGALAETMIQNSATAYANEALRMMHAFINVNFCFEEYCDANLKATADGGSICYREPKAGLNFRIGPTSGLQTCRALQEKYNVTNLGEYFHGRGMFGQRLPIRRGGKIDAEYLVQGLMFDSKVLISKEQDENNHEATDAKQKFNDEQKKEGKKTRMSREDLQELWQKRTRSCVQLEGARNMIYGYAFERLVVDDCKSIFNATDPGMVMFDDNGKDDGFQTKSYRFKCLATPSMDLPVRASKCNKDWYNLWYDPQKSALFVREPISTQKSQLNYHIGCLVKKGDSKYLTIAKSSSTDYSHCYSLKSQEIQDFYHMTAKDLKPPTMIKKFFDMIHNKTSKASPGDSNSGSDEE